jgi:hypothetical protein
MIPKKSLIPCKEIAHIHAHLSQMGKRNGNLSYLLQMGNRNVNLSYLLQMGNRNGNLSYLIQMGNRNGNLSYLLQIGNRNMIPKKSLIPCKENAHIHRSDELTDLGRASSRMS